MSRIQFSRSKSAFNFLHVQKNSQLFFASADLDEIENISRMHRFGLLLYLIAFGPAFVSVAASVATCLTLAIFVAFAGPTDHDVGLAPELPIRRNITTRKFHYKSFLSRKNPIEYFSL